MVARFNEYATITGANTVNLNVSGSQVGSYFNIYYNPNRVSSMLNGTGFASDAAGAKLIYSGNLAGSNTGTFINNGMNQGPNANNSLDQSGSGNTAQQSVSGNGGETLYISTRSFDRNFFVSDLTNRLLTFVTTNDLVFHQTAASKSFYDVTAGTPITPSLPSINGLYDSSTRLRPGKTSSSRRSAARVSRRLSCPSRLRS